jgi:hypothetical protein
MGKLGWEERLETRKRPVLQSRALAAIAAAWPKVVNSRVTKDGGSQIVTQPTSAVGRRRQLRQIIAIRSVGRVRRCMKFWRLLRHIEGRRVAPAACGPDPG